MGLHARTEASAGPSKAAEAVCGHGLRASVAQLRRSSCTSHHNSDLLQQDRRTSDRRSGNECACRASLGTHAGQSTSSSCTKLRGKDTAAVEESAFVCLFVFWGEVHYLITLLSSHRLRLHTASAMNGPRKLLAQNWHLVAHDVCSNRWICNIIA